MVTDNRPSKNGASAVADKPATPRRGRPRKESPPAESESSPRPSAKYRGIVQVRALCVGTSPIMFDPMTDETQDALAFGTHVQIKKDIPHREVAAAKVTRNEAGDIIIPVGNLRACMVGGGTQVKFDAKSKISTLGSTKLFGFFWIRSEELLLMNKDGQALTDKDWEVDKRPGRLDNGTAIVIRRPKFKDWAFEVVFEYDENLISQDKLIELFRAAGVTQGLCSFRPNRKGDFGMFELRRWVEEARRPAIRNLEIVRLDDKAA